MSFHFTDGPTGKRGAAGAWKLRYRAPARYDDEIAIATTASLLRGYILKFGYRIVRATDRKLLAEGETVHVVTDTYDREMQRAIGALAAIAILGVVAILLSGNTAGAAPVPGGLRPETARETAPPRSGCGATCSCWRPTRSAGGRPGRSTMIFTIDLFLKLDSQNFTAPQKSVE